MSVTDPNVTDPNVTDPAITIRSGRPTPVELTAVVVALVATVRDADTRARRADRTAEVDTGRSVTGWGAPGHGFRAPLVPGPGAWRQASGAVRLR